MGLVRLVLFLLFLLGLAFAEGETPSKNPEPPKKEESKDPRYHEWARFLVSAPDYRLEKLSKLRWPFIEVQRADRWREERDTNKGIPHEWRLPMSTLSATQEVARDLRKAWQRFEERYYWHVITRLNNPALYVIYCWAGLKGPDLDPPLPEVRLDVPSGVLPTGYNPGLDYPPPAAQGQHRLDAYWPVPQVDPDEFCDGLGLGLLPIMYIPGFCIDIEGLFSWCTPGYEGGEPLWFNEDAAFQRVQDGIAHAIRYYYTDYQMDVLKALRPRVPVELSNVSELAKLKVFAPMPWQMHVLGAGAVVTPVTTGIDGLTPQSFLNDVKKIVEVLEKALPNLPEAERLAGIAYYYQALRSLARLPLVKEIADSITGLLANMDEEALTLILTGLSVADQALKLTGKDVINAKNAPGAWRLEELKRWFPPSNPYIYERFGYVSFFQVWNRLEATTVPDFRQDRNPIGVGASLAMRTIFYWWVPVRIKIRLMPIPPFISISGQLDLPRPIPVAPYVLPFTGERTYWGWVSVPEGYEIPRVRGIPGVGLSDVSIPGFGPEVYDILLKGPQPPKNSQPPQNPQPSR